MSTSAFCKMSERLAHSRQALRARMATQTSPTKPAAHSGSNVPPVRLLSLSAMENGFRGNIEHGDNASNPILAALSRRLTPPHSVIVTQHRARDCPANRARRVPPARHDIRPSRGSGFPKNGTRSGPVSRVRTRSKAWVAQALGSSFRTWCETCLRSVQSSGILGHHCVVVAGGHHRLTEAISCGAVS